MEALTAAGFPASAADGVLHVDAPPDRGADVTRALADRGLYLSELTPERIDLETVFLELTKERP
jgi:ABC-2 type transport system ATP-binding protein